MSVRYRGAVAAIASLAIHVLFMQGMLLSGGGERAPRTHKEGLGANAIASEQEAVATLILIESPGVGAPTSEPLDLTASHGKVLQALRLTIVSPEPTFDLAIDAQEEAQPAEEASPEDSTADRQARAELFGRYLGQLHARIERAWLRPRTPIGAETFECRVQIVQDEQRKVREVSLQRCNGDSRWQVSLVDAIERASPLPAPPEPKVFAEALQLSFQSRPYDPGRGDDGFEPVAFVVSVTGTQR